jgi:nitroimidazol reductase NimA-like FMN-containing flavoprotein (pyridoxamine 5'-phosphate oxidase superfamily)
VDLSQRTELRRFAGRGKREWEAIHPILDAGFLAHVGFSIADQPFVIPTLYGRQGERLYLHGSAASRMLRALASGVAACVTVTIVDGLVLSRSAFDHSMNYRSVVAFGQARRILDPADKLVALRVISEHLIAGRWAEVRPPSEPELRKTTVLEFAIEEASAKTRSGPPLDEESDRGFPVWAGTLPLAVSAGPPVPDSGLVAGVGLPDYVERYEARLRTGAKHPEG